MANECEGCLSYLDNAYSEKYCNVGIIPHIEGTEGCPCRTCLVKMMCSHHVCVEFIKYRYISRRKRSYREVKKDIMNGDLLLYK